MYHRGASHAAVNDLVEGVVILSVTVWHVDGWFNQKLPRPGAAVLVEPTLQFVVIGAFSLN